MVSSTANLCSRSALSIPPLDPLDPLEAVKGTPMATRRRYALVGTGSRAEMFVRSLCLDHRDTAALVALCDTNPHRLRTQQRLAAGLGAPEPAGYAAADFAEMLAKEQVDTVVVTTVDSTHEAYIVAALR